ncbi:MAG: YggS family pyridoxal phosphate-dependent enzyme [Elusimicrobiota bacterium]
MRDIQASTGKIIKNLSQIREKINSISSSFKPEIMGVIKYASDEDILSAAQAGIKIMGESRVQDAADRWAKPQFSEIRNSLDLHFIGRLQSNKISKAVKIFDSIDSVDSLEIAEKINQKISTGKKYPIMIQLKINSAPSQAGIEEKDFPKLYERIKALANISLRGIMAIGPISEKKEELSEAFMKAKKIYDSYFSETVNEDGFRNYLSMGMSSDFETACEAGSSLIRIGSALFERDSGGKQ